MRPSHEVIDEMHDIFKELSGLKRERALVQILAKIEIDTTNDILGKLLVIFQEELISQGKEVEYLKKQGGNFDVRHQLGKYATVEKIILITRRFKNTI